MKNIQKYSLATLLAFVIGGCSGDAGFLADEEVVVNSVELKVGEIVEVRKGDTLSPANDATQINIEHIIGEDIKKVTLLAGEATLIYGDYNLEETN